MLPSRPGVGNADRLESAIRDHSADKGEMIVHLDDVIGDDAIDQLVFANILWNEKWRKRIHHAIKTPAAGTQKPVFLAQLANAVNDFIALLPEPYKVEH